jgi:hypothetical protein
MIMIWPQFCRNAAFSAFGYVSSTVPTNELFYQKVSLVKIYVLFPKKDASDALNKVNKQYLPHNDNIQRITVGDVCVEITAVIGVLPEYEKNHYNFL